MLDLYPALERSWRLLARASEAFQANSSILWLGAGPSVRRVEDAERAVRPPADVGPSWTAPPIAETASNTGFVGVPDSGDVPAQRVVASNGLGSGGEAAHVFVAPFAGEAVYVPVLAGEQAQIAVQ